MIQINAQSHSCALIDDWLVGVSSYLHQQALSFALPAIGSRTCIVKTKVSVRLGDGTATVYVLAAYISLLVAGSELISGCVIVQANAFAKMHVAWSWHKRSHEKSEISRSDSATVKLLQ